MGMRKKMKLFIAMVSVGALLGTMPVMAAEQPELPTKYNIFRFAGNFNPNFSFWCDKFD